MVSTNDPYTLALRQVLTTVPRPTLQQLIADGDDLVDRVKMPEADPEDAEPDEDE